MDIQKGELVFVRLLLPLLSGIISAIFFPVSTFTLTLVLSVSLLLFSAFWLCNSYYKTNKVFLSRWKPGLLLQLFIFFAAITLTLNKNQKLNSSHFSNYQNEALVVTVNSEPAHNAGIVRFEAKVNQGLLNSKFHSQTGSLLLAVNLIAFRVTSMETSF